MKRQELEEAGDRYDRKEWHLGLFLAVGVVIVASIPVGLAALISWMIL